MDFDVLTPLGAQWVGRPRRSLAAMAVLLLLTTGTCGAASSERELKASFILRIAAYVEWSPQHMGSKNFEIGVVGDPALADTLDRLSAELTLHDLPIHVKRADTLAEIENTHLVFLSAGASPGRDERPGVLTMGDARSFAADGGMVALFRRGDRMRFEINLAAATRAGLRISSKLLRLASEIHGRPSDAALSVRPTSVLVAR